MNEWKAYMNGEWKLALSSTEKYLSDPQRSIREYPNGDVPYRLPFGSYDIRYQFPSKDIIHQTYYDPDMGIYKDRDTIFHDRWKATLYHEEKDNACFILLGGGRLTYAEYEYVIERYYYYNDTIMYKVIEGYTAPDRDRIVYQAPVFELFTLKKRHPLQ
ncbi:MAG: hypothetical protein JNL32_09000 [Candidatus Kapabacteria bacterium]|nr:hypothetical protein [Candidatus Kapabacteria bacterium]